MKYRIFTLFTFLFMPTLYGAYYYGALLGNSVKIHVPFQKNPGIFTFLNNTKTTISLSKNPYFQALWDIFRPASRNNCRALILRPSQNILSFEKNYLNNRLQALIKEHNRVALEINSLQKQKENPLLSQSLKRLTSSATSLIEQARRQAILLNANKAADEKIDKSIANKKDILKALKITLHDFILINKIPLKDKENSTLATLYQDTETLIQEEAAKTAVPEKKHIAFEYLHNAYTNAEYFQHYYQNNPLEFDALDLEISRKYIKSLALNYLRKEDCTEASVQEEAQKLYAAGHLMIDQKLIKKSETLLKIAFYVDGVTKNKKAPSMEDAHRLFEKAFKNNDPVLKVKALQAIEDAYQQGDTSLFPS